MIDDLVLWESICRFEKVVTSFCEDQDSQGLFLRDWDGLVSNQTVADEPANVPLHTVSIPTIGMLREVRRRNDAELANFC